MTTLSVLWEHKQAHSLLQRSNTSRFSSNKVNQNLPTDDTQWYLRPQAVNSVSWLTIAKQQFANSLFLWELLYMPGRILLIAMKEITNKIFPYHKNCWGLYQRPSPDPRDQNQQRDHAKTTTSDFCVTHGLPKPGAYLSIHNGCHPEALAWPRNR